MEKINKSNKNNKYILKGKMLDEDGNLKHKEIVVNNGLIEKIEEKIDINDKNDNNNFSDYEVIDLGNKLITPGFIDVHVHLREPGFSHKETMESGSKAALKGGYTQIFAMPNVNPVPDNKEKMEDMYERAKKAFIKVKFYSPITIGQLGQELVDFDGLYKGGAVGFTDDGRGVQNAAMMREAMIKAKELDLVVAAHCEDNSLILGGYIHEGKYSKSHGHKGIPGSCEDVQVARDILLSTEVGAKYHVCHMSTAKGVDLLSLGKSWGGKVTGEVTPHHLILCDEDIKEHGNYKMNPPLRSKDDRKRLIEGLNEGIIEVIATDHAPHSVEEKERGLAKSPFGIIGTEDAFPLLYTELVLTGKVKLKTVVDAMTKGPREVFSLKEGVLKVGAPADITAVDLEGEYTIDVDNFKSLSKNSPFNGKKVKSVIDFVMVDGEIRLSGGEIIE